MPLTQAFTFQYGDTGILINGDDISPTAFVDVYKVSGLDSAEPRTTERDREDMDGGFVDALYERMRTVVISGMIYGTEAFLDQLKANYALTRTSKAFYFRADGSVNERIVFAKSLGLRYDWESLRRTGQTPFQIQLKVEDPTIFDATLQTGETDLGGTSSGAGFNMAFNMGFGGTVSTPNAVYIINAGNKDTDANITINGPVTNPAIVHDNTGRRLDFNITVGAGEQLNVNLRNKSIKLNNDANRRNTLVSASRWFMLVPGSNGIRFLGTSAGTPTMVVEARSAYR